MRRRIQTLHLGRWLTGLLALLSALGTAGADGIPAPRGYTPIYLMYSGEPSPARLQDLRRFLEANHAPDAVVQDALETVVHKLNTFKAGFAYPVYFSEHSRSGNACVIAESDHQVVQRGAGLLVSDRVAIHMLGGRMPKLAWHEVADKVMQHELFHCYDLLRFSLHELGLRILAEGAAYFSYRGEVGADAYAALVYLRAGGDKRLLRTIRDFRTLNLINGDAVHYTAPTLDHIIWRYDPRSLRGLSTEQLLELAGRVRDETVLSADEFARLDAAASHFERTFRERIGETLPPATMATLSGMQASPEYRFELFQRVRAALHALGGDIGPGNTVFDALARTYQLPQNLLTVSYDTRR